MSLSKNQIIEAEITSISSDGNGVTRYNGEVVFVPGAAVGDVLELRIVRTEKRFCYAKLEKILVYGAGRIPQDCPIGEKCGGCSLRHISYEAELDAKQQIVTDALFRIGGLTINPLPIIPSPSIERYRNKVQYPVASSSNGSTIYGFYAKRSHRVIPCSDCLLQPKIINDVAGYAVELLDIYNIPAYDEETQNGTIRHL